MNTWIYCSHTLTWPVQRPTTKSAMKVSSVSPERWLTITPQPLDWASLQLRDGRKDENTCYSKQTFQYVQCVACQLMKSSILKAISVCGHSRLEGLCDRANLVDLQQQAVAGLFWYSLSNAFGVGHSQIVTHHLDAGAGGELGPGFPVILVKGILNRDN